VQIACPLFAIAKGRAATTMAGAVRAAEEMPVALHAMAYDPAAAVLARGSEPLDGTFETVKGVGLALSGDDKRFVIVVPAGVAFCHRFRKNAEREA